MAFSSTDAAVKRKKREEATPKPEPKQFNFSVKDPYQGSVQG